MSGMYLSLQTPLIVYGCGELGECTARNLVKKGYNIVCGLDKNKSGGELIPGCPIYQLEAEQSLKEKAIVIICLANGMLHKKVAEELYQEGYLYLVFLPMEYALSTKEKNRLTYLYNDVIFAELPRKIEHVVYSYDTYLLYDFNERKSILLETETTIVTYVRLEMLFSEFYEIEEKPRKGNSRIEDQNLNMAQYPMSELFLYFSLKQHSYQKYIDMNSNLNSEKEIEKELQKREQLYKLFKTELEKGMDFFIQGAPSVIRNPRHYFNLTGGHHRTSFLISENKTLLPVRMKKSDFDIWNNRDCYIQFQKWIIENEIGETYAPIPHPGMLDFPAKYEVYGKTRMYSVLNFLSTRKYKGSNVLEIGDSEGYYSRILLKCGARDAQYTSKDKKKNELAKKVAELLYIDGLCISESIQGTYDIVFAMEQEKTRGFFELTNKFLFIELNENVSWEKELLEDGFKEYYIIYSEICNGIKKNLIVCCK